MSYQNLVMTTAVVVAASAETKHITQDKKLVAKPIIAAFGLGIFLFILGMASENVGTKFCYLVMLTAILINGESLFAALTPKK
jgi:membrane protein CcdC involved in cytochrome C biogenesis